MVWPKVAAVVLNYRTPGDTLEAVASLEASGYENLEIIVVDNGPGGDWGKALATLHPEVVFFRNENNLGFSGGCNVGIRRALEGEAAYILLFNSDAIATPELIERLVRYAESHSRVGVLGPTILAEDGNSVWYQGGMLNRILGYTSHPGMGQPLPKMSGVARATDFIPGTAMLVRRDVFERVGLLDEDYFLYLEDVDLSERAREAGFGVVHCLSATALHKVSASAGVRGTNVMTPLRAYYFARNMILFLKKHAKGLRKWTSLQGQIYVRAPYRFLTMTMDGESPSFRHYLRGMWDGLLGRTGKWVEHDRFAT